MKKCCECKKIIWPWKQSKISTSPIHLACHQKIIEKAANIPALKAMYAAELNDFEARTSINTGLKI